jgi:hypothetical protein
MQCSNCGRDNRPNYKFCSDCGTPLVTKCGRCGATYQPDQKFSGDCGAQLQVEAASVSVLRASLQVDDTAPLANGVSTPPEGKRKTITALFAEIKDSTELIREIDPEEARYHRPGSATYD